MRFRIILVVALAIFPAVAHAQRVPGLVNSTADRAVEQPLNGGFLAQIQAVTDDSTATVKTGWTISDTRQDLKDGSKRKLHLFDTITLSASAPLSKGGSGTTVFGSDGFPNAFTFKTKFIQYRKMETPRTLQEEEELNTLCDKVQAIAEKPDPATVRLAKEFGKTDKEATAIATRLAHDDSFLCSSETVTKFAKDQRPAFDRLNRIGIHGQFIWGGSTSVGHTQFKYFNSDLTKGSTRDMPWGGSAFIASMPRQLNTLLTLGFDYKNKRKDAAAKTLCPQGGGSGPMECKTGPIGAPVNANEESAYVELRREFRNRALSLKVAYDVRKKHASLDLPIYLFPSADNGLTGGIRVGWVETQGAQIGVFVNSAFSIFPQ